MIHVEKNFEKRINALNKKSCREIAKQALDEKTQHKARSYYYSDDEVLSSLNDIYHGKCAYCESKVSPVATIEIDHYRPRKKAKDDPQHHGYYWLVYEWSNFLPACPTCNRKKSNQFPILGVRVYSPSLNTGGKWDRGKCDPRKNPLKSEQPLLLNPELDQPESHLQFKKDNTGKIMGKTKRGEVTISVCELNREELCIARKKKIEQFFKSIQNIILSCETDKNFSQSIVKSYLFIMFDELKKKGDPNSPYSLLGKFIYQEFDFFVKKLFKPDYHDTLCQIFREYKA